MRKLALSLTAGVVLALAVPATAATPVVLVKDDFFKPERVVIKKGGAVTWRWKGSNPHNVAIKKPGSNKVVKRSTVKTSGKYTTRFRSTGKWRVLCEKAQKPSLHHRFTLVRGRDLPATESRLAYTSPVAPVSPATLPLLHGLLSLRGRV